MSSQESISSSNEKKENPNEVKEKLGQIWINIPLFIILFIYFYIYIIKKFQILQLNLQLQKKDIYIY